MVLHRNIYKYAWTFLSNMFYIRSFRGANCDTGNYLVVAKFRERLAVCKKAAQKFHI
jgi:hypothetical protein